MYCLLSFIFIFVVVVQAETNAISLFQAILYGIYGLAMFYHTSKSYWSENNQ